MLEAIDPLILESGERLQGQIGKYYDYGVSSVVFELPFSGEWETLVRRLPDAGYGMSISSAMPPALRGSDWSAPLPR